jgi:hypothetical protein
MERYVFTGTGELTEKAFEVYSDSDIVFYTEDGEFYAGMNRKEQPFYVGNIADVIELLETLA